MANHEHDAAIRESENTYELIVLAAREAERINASRIAPPDAKPTSLAIERVARGEATPRTDEPPDAA
jgi:DNA-directed RNA polymerase subunit K/omega